MRVKTKISKREVNLLYIEKYYYIIKNITVQFFCEKIYIQFSLYNFYLEEIYFKKNYLEEITLKGTFVFKKTLKGTSESRLLK